MVVTINVTKEDILRGCRRMSSECAVARAINRVVREIGFIAKLNSNFICFMTTKGVIDTQTVSTPLAVASFIIQYDTDDTYYACQPFSFDLDLPFIKEKDVDVAVELQRAVDAELAVQSQQGDSNDVHVVTEMVTVLG